MNSHKDDETETSQLDIERARLQIEEAKVEMELMRFKLEPTKAAHEYEIFQFKAALILNGGAIVALLALMGSILVNEGDAALLRDLTILAGCFATGMVLATTATVLVVGAKFYHAYASVLGPDESGRPTRLDRVLGRFHSWSSTALIKCSLAAFSAGSIVAVAKFVERFYSI
ncbi:MAG: hypothetical protein OXH50_14715 [Gemmatimonadetes bacterium]|nr:hypothetical protein [Gemmatimonadota bacterium]